MANRQARSAKLVGLAAVLALAACSPDEILEVEDIDVALPEAVQDATALPSILAGAIGEFGVAYNGGGDFNVITLAGQLSDELHNTETFPTRIEVDQRRQQPQSNGSLRDLYYDVHQARAMAERAAAAYERLSPADVGHAEALNLAGLTYIFFAENYCGAVPVSRELGPGNFEYGQMLSTTQLLDSAVAKAARAQAIAQAVADATTNSAAVRASGTAQVRLARLVQARALLNLDRPADAATIIGGEAGVPSNYQYIYRHSQTTARQNNGTWAVTASVGRFGVPDREGGNGLPFRSEGDAANTTSRDLRVPSARRTNNQGRGFDNSTIQWIQQKHATRDTLAIIADGVEARLIEAEAQLRASNPVGALATLNALRSNGTIARQRGYLDANSQPILLPNLTLQATPEAQVDQLFKERAYWLFLTGHRLGDLRRLIRTQAPGYARGAETVFPTGNYHKSGTYGTDVNSPVPQAEENNPNFQRSACSATQA
jgi:hypothetical protein